MKFVPPGKINGRCRAPSSKSMLQRAILAAAVCNEVTIIRFNDLCDDATAAIGVAQGLGARIVHRDGELEVRGGNGSSARTLSCGESGLCLRMTAAIAALYPRPIRLEAEGSLKLRPISMVEAPLRALGAMARTQEGYPPLDICGPLRGGTTRVDGSTTSQFLSGLLTALPLCDFDSHLVVEGLVSAPYIAMTVEMLRRFGAELDCLPDFSEFWIRGAQRYRGTEVRIEGDWSGAACLLVAGAVGGRIEVDDLHTRSLQADRAILGALERSGATVELNPNSVVVSREGPLRGFSFDATHCPDLFPALTVLACCCEGVSIISGTQRLRFKESDRKEALLSELRKLGAAIEARGGALEVTGGPLRGGVVASHNDHRIAMAGAVAGLISDSGVSIDGAECVSKSYPGFFSDLMSVRRER